MNRLHNPPLAIDLCCGSGGWTDGFLAEGYRVIGFDVRRHPDYRGQLVLQDIQTIDGTRLSGAAVIVASPPCEEFSRHDQPWTRKRNPPLPDCSLVEACFRIAREAGVPLVLENVRGAQKFIGGARARWGGRYLWGDVPAVLPYFDGGLKKWMRGARYWKRSRIEPTLARHIARLHFPATPSKAVPT